MSKWEVVKVGDWWTIMRDDGAMFVKRAGVLCGKRTGAMLFEDEAEVMMDVLNEVDKYDGHCDVQIVPT